MQLITSSPTPPTATPPYKAVQLGFISLIPPFNLQSSDITPNFALSHKKNLFIQAENE